MSGGESCLEERLLVHRRLILTHTCQGKIVQFTPNTWWGTHWAIMHGARECVTCTLLMIGCNVPTRDVMLENRDKETCMQTCRFKRRDVQMQHSCKLVDYVNRNTFRDLEIILY